MPSVVGEIHFQKTTSSCIKCDLTFCLSSMLKICSCRWAAGRSLHQLAARDPSGLVDRFGAASGDSPRRAMTFSSRCMMADSAEMGLRMTLLASERSIITTCLVPLTSSRTQMNFSLSMVKVANPMEAGWMPKLDICESRQQSASLVRPGTRHACAAELSTCPQTLLGYSTQASMLKELY